MKRRRIGTTLVCAVLLGCTSKAVTAPRAVVPEPVPSALRAAATTSSPFGHMVALGIGVSNGSARDYLISADRVLAVDREGNRVAPLSAAEAARQAGGTTALVAGLRGAGAGALLAGVVAAIPGAVIGAAEGGGRGAGTGAAVGAGIGAAVGAVGGFYHEDRDRPGDHRPARRALPRGEDRQARHSGERIRLLPQGGLRRRPGGSRRAPERHRGGRLRADDEAGDRLTPGAEHSSHRSR
jgi:hypothetical protein